MEHATLLTKINQYAQAIGNYRPLSVREVQELDAYFKIGMTYWHIEILSIRHTSIISLIMPIKIRMRTLQQG